MFEEIEKKDISKRQKIYSKKLITKYLGLPDYTEEDEKKWFNNLIYISIKN